MLTSTKHMPEWRLIPVLTFVLSLVFFCSAHPSSSSNHAAREAFRRVRREDPPDFFVARGFAAEDAVIAYHDQHDAALNLVRSNVLPKAPGYEYNADDWSEEKKQVVYPLVEEYYKKAVEAKSKRDAYSRLRFYALEQSSDRSKPARERNRLRNLVELMAAVDHETNDLAHKYLAVQQYEELSDQQARYAQYVLEHKLNWVDWAFNTNTLISNEVRHAFLQRPADAP